MHLAQRKGCGKVQIAISSIVSCTYRSQNTACCLAALSLSFCCHKPRQSLKSLHSKKLPLNECLPPLVQEKAILYCRYPMISKHRPTPIQDSRDSPNTDGARNDLPLPYYFQRQQLLQRQTQRQTQEPNARPQQSPWKPQAIRLPARSCLLHGLLSRTYIMTRPRCVWLNALCWSSGWCWL